MDQKYYENEKPDDELLKKIAQSLIEEVLTMTSKKLKKKISELVVLDVGSGYGYYAVELAKHVKKVVAVEPYTPAHEVAKKKSKKNLSFYNAMIEDFNTKDRFDLVLSLTTLEHMPNAHASFERIFQLLKKNGIIYLTVPNKLWPIESHYSLPFLAYLPLAIADAYLRITGKGTSYKDCSYTPTYFDIHKLFRQFPCTYNFLLPDPDSLYVGLGNTSGIYHTIKKMGISLIKKFPFLWVFSKGFIVLIEKR